MPLTPSCERTYLDPTYAKSFRNLAPAAGLVFLLMRSCLATTSLRVICGTASQLR